jgi:hypothetical protein
MIDMQQDAGGEAEETQNSRVGFGACKSSRQPKHLVG